MGKFINALLLVATLFVVCSCGQNSNKKAEPVQNEMAVQSADSVKADDRGYIVKVGDMVPEFDRIIVGHPHAYYLRKHAGGNIIGIWCHADKFARKEGLHGLFSGMIISDKREAEEYGIITLQHLIDEANEVMFAKLRQLLDNQVPLHEIPERMKALNDKPSWLTCFNYGNFYYL